MNTYALESLQDSLQIEIVRKALKGRQRLFSGTLLHSDV